MLSGLKSILSRTKSIIDKLIPPGLKPKPKKESKSKTKRSEKAPSKTKTTQSRKGKGKGGINKPLSIPQLVSHTNKLRKARKNIKAINKKNRRRKTVYTITTTKDGKKVTKTEVSVGESIEIKLPKWSDVDRIKTYSDPVIFEKLTNDWRDNLIRAIEGAMDKHNIGAQTYIERIKSMSVEDFLSMMYEPNTHFSIIDNWYYEDQGGISYMLTELNQFLSKYGY